MTGNRASALRSRWPMRGAAAIILVASIVVAVAFGGFIAAICAFYAVCSLIMLFMSSKRGQAFMQGEQAQRPEAPPSRPSEAYLQRKAELDWQEMRQTQRRDRLGFSPRQLTSGREPAALPARPQGAHGPGCSCGIGLNRIAPAPDRKQLPR
jgi:hypothetical protein